MTADQEYQQRLHVRAALETNALTEVCHTITFTNGVQRRVSITGREILDVLEAAEAQADALRRELNEQVSRYLVALRAKEEA